MRFGNCVGEVAYPPSLQTRLYLEQVRGLAFPSVQKKKESQTAGSGSG